MNKNIKNSFIFSREFLLFMNEPELNTNDKEN